MGKIAIVYWSGTGNTEAMANFVAEGAGGQADRPWAPSSWRRPNLSPCSRR